MAKLGTNRSRCSLCGAPRIPINREGTRFGACTFVDCKDPAHDYNLEKSEPEPTPEPQAVVKHESRLAEIDDLLNCPQIAPPSTRALLSVCVYLRRKLKEASANHCETCQKYRQALETILQWPYEDHAVIARNALKTSAEPQAGSEPSVDDCVCTHGYFDHYYKIAEQKRTYCTHCSCGAYLAAPAEPPVPGKEVPPAGSVHTESASARQALGKTSSGAEPEPPAPEFEWECHGKWRNGWMCGYRMQAGEGKPTICPKCQSNNWVEVPLGEPRLTRAEPEPPRGGKSEQTDWEWWFDQTNRAELIHQLRARPSSPSPALGVLPSAFRRFVEYTKANLADVCGKACEHIDCAETKEELKLADKALASLSQKEGE